MELELNVFHEAKTNNQPRKFLKNPDTKESLSLFERNGKLQRKRTAVHLDENDPDAFLFILEEPKAKRNQSVQTETKPPKAQPPSHSYEKPKSSDETKSSKKSLVERDDEEESYDRFCFTCGFVNNCSETCFTEDDQGNLINNFCIEF